MEAVGWLAYTIKQMLDTCNACAAQQRFLLFLCSSCIRESLHVSNPLLLFRAPYQQLGHDACCTRVHAHLCYLAKERSSVCISKQIVGRQNMIVSNLLRITTGSRIPLSPKGGLFVPAHWPLPRRQGWEELMMVVESAMAGARKEVALAAIGVITTVMGAHGAGPAVGRPMWRRALRAMGVGVEAAASPRCGVPLQARLELVAAIGQVQARAPARAVAHHYALVACTLAAHMQEGQGSRLHGWSTICRKGQGSGEHGPGARRLARAIIGSASSRDAGWVTALRSASCLVPLRWKPLMRWSSLKQTVCASQAALRPVMEEGDVRETYEWLERLARNPYADDDATPVVPGARSSYPCGRFGCHYRAHPGRQGDLEGNMPFTTSSSSSNMPSPEQPSAFGVQGSYRLLCIHAIPGIMRHNSFAQWQQHSPATAEIKLPCLV